MNSKSHRGADGTFKIRMNKNEVFLMMTDSIYQDLTGTNVISNKPIAITAGHVCAYVPTTSYACNHLEEMLRPTDTWGFSYLAFPFATRKEGDTYRVFASDINTNVYINGSLYKNLITTSSDCNNSWFEFQQPPVVPLVFSTDKPISVVQYSNGSFWDRVLNSDPSMLTLTPTEQFINETHFTTLSTSIVTFKHYLNIISDSLGLFDLEIYFKFTDKWNNLFSVFGNSFSTFSYKVNGVTYVGKTISIPDGEYALRSKSLFAGYLYGYNETDAYSVPLNAGTKFIHLLDSFKPKVMHIQDCLSNVDALAQDLPFDSLYRSNLSIIFLDPDSSFNYELIVDPFIPGLDSIAHFKLNVIDKSKDARGIIIVSDMSGNSVCDTIFYFTFSFKFNLNSLDFGLLYLPKSIDSSVIFSNSSVHKLNLKPLYLLNANNGFSIIKPTSPFTIDSSQSLTCFLKFASSARGTFFDTLVCEQISPFGVDFPCKKVLLPLKAKVVAILIKVSDIDFGTIVVNSTSLDSFSINNASLDFEAKLSVFNASGIRTPAFSFTNGLPSLPFVLNFLDHNTVNVSFNPSVPGSFIDTIFFSHNAYSNPLNDSIAIIKGKAVYSQLFASDFDWGRIRVKSGWQDGSVL